MGWLDPGSSVPSGGEFASERSSPLSVKPTVVWLQVGPNVTEADYWGHLGLLIISHLARMSVWLSVSASEFCSSCAGLLH